jgi:ATP-dependent Lon protease
MKRNDMNYLKNPLPIITSELSYDLLAADLDIPDTMNLLPMAELNSFPHLISSIAVDEVFSRGAVEKSCDSDQYLALFALKSFEVDTSGLRKEDFYPVGVAARILKVSECENSPLKVTVQGLCRVKLSEILTKQPTSLVKIRPIDDRHEKDESLTPLILEARRLFAEAIKLIPGIPVNLFKVNRILDEQPSVLADLIMASLPLKPELKAEYLLIENLKHRYLKLLEHLTMEVSNRQLGRAITQRIENSLDRRHKEVQLREQIKAIKAELGEEEDFDSLNDLNDRIQSLYLPSTVKAAAERELHRLKITAPQSAEYSTIRNFLEWIIELPWNISTPETTDLAKARELLERDHFGLEKVKKRILEFLAVHKLTNSLKTPILCLTGPPGVGKTSLGRSIAEALGRKFVRLSLGGLKDEAEIRGHRRTYVGARPGRIVTGLRKAGVNNPVFLLDELDKLGSGINSDPSAALLEVLDPEQNDTFTDNFLEVPFDLSKVMFILTANVLENIPGPLRDRLEIVEVNGYTLDEKVNIARQHLWPKELERHGLTESDVEMTDDALETIVSSYTWEAGCRELGRQLGAIIRSRAVAKAENMPIDSVVSSVELKEILGPPRRHQEHCETSAQTGVVTGLAWTAAGGDIMFIEAVAMPGKGRLSLTGQLGEVMRESAQAAISYVRSRANDWFISDSWFQEHDIHIHLPHGAIPKDGPSAGISLATSVVSLITSQKVRPEVGMTGEISLRGLVLPVGGIKEKLLAAKRAGLTTILVPERNQPEISELPSAVTDGLNIVMVNDLDQVLDQALLPTEDLFSCEPFSYDSAAIPAFSQPFGFCELPLP